MNAESDIRTTLSGLLIGPNGAAGGRAPIFPVASGLYGHATFRSRPNLCAVFRAEALAGIQSCVAGALGYCKLT